MNHGIVRIHLSMALYVLSGFLCIAALAGCADTHVISADQISNAAAEVTLSWGDVPGAISYNIYFSRTAALTKWNSHKISGALSPFTITDLVRGKTYYFGISIIDGSGESDILREQAYTAADKKGVLDFSGLTPGTQNLKGQAPGARVPDGQVTLSWDNVPNAVSYNIYYSESPGVTKQKGKKIANVKNPHTIKGLKKRNVYYFVVTAVSKTGESKESEELSFTVK